MACESVEELVERIVDESIGENEVWENINSISTIIGGDPFDIAAEAVSTIFDISKDVVIEANNEEEDKLLDAGMEFAKVILTSGIKIAAGGGVVGLLFALGDIGKASYDFYKAAELD